MENQHHFLFGLSEPDTNENSKEEVHETDVKNL
jgi:hypothetical protein